MPYTAGTVFLEVATSFDGIQDEARRQTRRAFSDLDKEVAPGLAKVEKAAEQSGERTGKKYGSAMERIIKTRLKSMKETINSLDTGGLRGDFRALRGELDKLGKLDYGILGKGGQRDAIAGIEGMRSHINKIFKDVEGGSRTASTAALTNLGALRNSLEKISKDTSKWLVGGDPDARAAEQQRIGKMQVQAAREMNAEFAKREQSVRKTANLQLQAARDEAKIRRQINTDDARAANEKLRLDIDQLKRDVQVKVVGAEEASIRLAALTREAQRLDGMRIRADVDVPSQAGNIIAMRALAQSIEQVGQESRKTGKWMKALDAGSAANSVRVFNGVLFTTLAIGPLLIPVLAGVGAGIVGIGVAAAGALLGIGALALGLSGIGGAVGAMNDLSKAQAADGSPKETANKAAKAERDSRAIADAERSLARARRDAARDQADSVRRLADAERRLSEAREDAKRRQADSARAIAEAEMDLVDARRDAARAAEEAANRVSDARERLASTQEDVARAAEDSASRVADAEERVVDAQKDALDAQKSINDARRQAVLDLMDLNFQLRGAVLGEQEAAFALEEAKVHYNVVLEDDQATDREKAVAKLDMEQAQLAYEQSQEQTKRLTAETADANKKGVEGSDLVVAAKERERDATESVADANEALRDARQEQVRQEKDNARAIADANEALHDAREDQSRTEQDNARSIADAQADVADARREAAEAASDSARTIADAERGITDARREAAESRVDSAEQIADAQRALAEANATAATNAAAAGLATGALATQTDNLALAMANLSPAGQAFATFLYGLKPLLDDLRFAAQENFLPGLQAGMELMVNTYGPGLVTFVGDMAKVLGDLSLQAAEMFTNPFWQEFFGEMAKLAPIFLQQFGDMALNLLTFFAGLGQAFAPLGLEIGDFFVRITESMADWATGLKGSEGFATFMGYIERIQPKVLELFAEAFEVLVKLLIGLAPYSEKLLDFFINLFDGLSKKSPEELAEMALAFGGIALGIQAIAGALSVISGVAGLLQSITLLGGMFRGLGSGIMTVVTALFGGGAAGGAASAAGGAVARKGLLAGIAALIGGPVGIAIGVISALALAFQLAYENIEPFRKAVDGLVAWMGGAFELLWIDYLEPWFTNMSEAWAWLQDEVISPVVTWFRRVFENTVKPAFEYLYKVAIKPTMDLISAIFGVITDVVGVFVHMFREVFEHIVLPAFNWLHDTVIEPVMTAIGDTIGWVWRHVIKPVFKALGNFIEDNVAPVFAAGVQAIADIWAGLINVLRAPIRFVVETIINDGLIGAFNWLADRTGMDKLEDIPIPAALSGVKVPKNIATPAGSDAGGRYATGGVLPGYTPGRDVHEFYSPTAGGLSLSGGEGIMRPELVQALGAGRFNAANAAARQGRVGEGLNHLGGFAKGGILDDIFHGAKDKVSSIVSGPAKWFRSIMDKLIGGESMADIPKALAKMAGGKTVSGLGSWVKDKMASLVGTEGGPGGSIQRLTQGLTWWKNLGASVAEFAPWGSVSPVHMKGSMHYLGRAGDLNYGAGTSAREQKFFDQNLGEFRKLFPDLHVLWRVPNHFNHMHIDNSRGDGSPGGYTGSLGGGPVQAQVRGVANRYGWGTGDAWNALSWIINKESSWNPNAANPTSSARGLFQKMTSVHGPVEPTAAGQAEWGLNYIRGRYGNPVSAKNFHLSHGYYEKGGIMPTLYDQGGDLPPGLSLVANKTRQPESILTKEMMTEVRERRGGDFTVDMRGSKFGYDPDDVAAAISRQRRDELALAGIDDGGDVW